MGDTILFRRGTATNLPDLQVGEPGFATDTKVLYIGAGAGTAEDAAFCTSTDIDAIQYEPNTYTQATIEAALTAIGTVNKVTLLLRPCTWVISSNADWSAYTNVTFKIVPGAVLQIATGTTTTFGGPFEAGLYKVFDCVGTGKVVFGNIEQVSPLWFEDDTTDIGAGIQLAIASLPQGGVVKLPTGSFTSNDVIADNGVPIVFRGSGVSQHFYQNPYDPCVLIKASAIATDFITLTGIGSRIEDIHIKGEVGNSGDGVVMLGAKQSLINTQVSLMGQDGIRIGSDAGASSNYWHLQNVFAEANVRRGVFIHDASGGGAVGSQNANAGSALFLSTRANGEDGLRILNGSSNTFMGYSCEINGNNGVTLVDNHAYNNTFCGGDFTEGNALYDLAIGVGSNNNHFFGISAGTPTILDEGTDTVIVSGGIAQFPSLTIGPSVKEIAATVSSLDATAAITIIFADQASVLGHVLEIYLALHTANATAYNSIVRYSLTSSTTAANITIADMTHDLIGGVTESVAVTNNVIVVTITAPTNITKISILARDVCVSKTATMSTITIA